MKNMKIFFVLFFTTAMAQKPDTTAGLANFSKSISMGLGYGFATGAGGFTEVYEDASGRFLQYNYGSFGKGLDINLGYSRKIHPVVSVGCDVSVFLGSKNTSVSQYYDTTDMSSDRSLGYYKANALKVMPFVQFDAYVNKNNSLYLRLGYVLGTAKKISNITYTYNVTSQNPEVVEFKFEGKGGLLNGVNFALGYRFKIDESTSFFVELNGSNLKQMAKEDHMTSATSSGRNILPYIDEFYKSTIFVDNVEDLPDNHVYTKDELNSPRKALKYNAIYNSCGLRLGFVFHFH